MALRNISNIHPMAMSATASDQWNCQQQQQQPLIAKTRKLTTNSSRARIVNTKVHHQQQTMGHHYYQPTPLNYQVPIPIQNQSMPKPQIRTSSPISSTTSDSFDAPPDGVFPNLAIKHLSIKELAYEKLRQQNKLANPRPKPSQSSVNPVRSNGKLKLVAYNNFGHLTVHIVKGKSYRAVGDTYVRIQILPDPQHIYKHYQTSVVKQPKQKPGPKQSSITYDEKFSFEVDSASAHHKHQRVCISVWCRPNHAPGAKHVANSLLSSHSSSSSLGSNSINSASASVSASTGLAADLLVGCFSFRVRSLMGARPEQAQAQWYHLLPESIGTHKHFRCHRTASVATVVAPQEDVMSKKPISDVNRDLIGLEKVKFRVEKSCEADSYGFTVTGNCPCMIGKVDTSKQAFSNGLRPGDFIASLNGKNVSRATCDSVVKLIKSHKNGFEIEVYREAKNQVEAQQQKQPKLLMTHQNILNTQVRTTTTKVVQSENVYYEIPSVRCAERPRNNYNLDVVPEETEEEEIESVECSDVEYSDEDDNDLSMVDQPRAAFQVEDIRHVDSDVNTEEEDYVAQVRQLSTRYLLTSKVTSL